MSKKLVAGILITAMLMTSLVGCKGGKTEDTLNSQEAVEQEGTNDANEPITFTFFSSDSTAGQQWDNFESKVSQRIKELTGVTIDAEFAIGDPAEKISLMVAGEDYADFVYVQEYSNVIQSAGGLLPLNDLIEEHMPNFKRVYKDDLAKLKWSNDDPQIYLFGTPEVNRTLVKPPSAFQLQHDVMRELNYPKMETLEDFENAIREYKNKYPTINGQPTIGFSLLADDWRIKISTTNPACFAAGGANDGEWYIDPDTYEAKVHVRGLSDGQKEYYRWLNKMYHEGLLDPESMTQKYDDYQAKISSGRVLALADSKWQYEYAELALKEEMPARMYGEYPITLSEDIPYIAALRNEGYAGGWGIGISKNCKDPVRAAKFIDFLCSEEGQVLRHWGIEGEHYLVDENGKRYHTPEMKKAQESTSFITEEGAGLMGWPWPGYDVTYIDEKGNATSPYGDIEMRMADATDVEKETLSKLGVKTWADLFPQADEIRPSDWGAAWLINIPQDSEEAFIMTRYDEILRKYVAKLIMGPSEDVDKTWDEMQQELVDIGIEKAEELMTKLVKEKVELFNS